MLELSIVLIIVALLTSGLIFSLSASQEAANRQSAERQLENAREALLGFAVANGRLPCPAAPGATGIESPPDGGNCTHPWLGFLPAITLGLQPINDAGFAVDPWGNPLRYAITTFTNPSCGTLPCISTANGLRNAWNSGTPPTPDLRVCNTASNITGSAASAECASGHAQTKDAVAVIFSRGRNGNLAPSGDEAINENNDRLFLSHTISLPPNEFDDQVAWLSSSVFYSRLMAAGRLP